MKLYAKEKAALSEAKTRLATNEELAEKLNVDTSKLQHEYERLQAEHLQLQLQKKAKLDLQAKQIQERIAAGNNHDWTSIEDLTNANVVPSLLAFRTLSGTCRFATTYAHLYVTCMYVLPCICLWLQPVFVCCLATAHA